MNLIECYLEREGYMIIKKDEIREIMIAGIVHMNGYLTLSETSSALLPPKEKVTRLNNILNWLAMKFGYSVVERAWHRDLVQWKQKCELLYLEQLNRMRIG